MALFMLVQPCAITVLHSMLQAPFFMMLIQIQIAVDR
jgi:hypothetical protein